MIKKMSTVTDVISKNIHPLKSHIISDKWKFSIDKQMETDYSLENEGKLMEFAFRVTTHNREKHEGKPNPLNLNPPNFNVVKPLDTTYLMNHVNAAWIFHSESLNTIVISFTGTYNNVLLLADASYSYADPTTINNYKTSIRLHGGFWNLYSNIQVELLNYLDQHVNDKTQIIITGFSLGGATSTICALDLYKRRLATNIVMNNILHYSYASPRVFNTEGAIHFDSLCIPSYRIANLSDMVINVPFPIIPHLSYKEPTEDFMHVYEMIYFDDNMRDYYDNHTVAYLKRHGL